LEERKISGSDLELLTLTDDPAEAARVVAEAYELQLQAAQARAAKGRKR
jgi:hypothetical protein